MAYRPYIAALTLFLVFPAEACAATPAATLKAAKESHQLRREQLSAKQAYQRDWFPNSILFSDAKARPTAFTQKGKDGKFSGDFLSVAGIAEPGDVLRLVFTVGGKSKAMTLVYVGEEAFPDSPDFKQSFFIYPYRTCLEYNTLPARMHDRWLNDELQRFGLEFGKEFISSSNKVQDSQRNTVWITLPHEKLSRVATNATGGTYSLYRPSDASLNANSQSIAKHGAFRGTSYKIKDGESPKITIEFDPSKSATVKNAERISFVSVGQFLIDGKPEFWSTELKSRTLDQIGNVSHRNEDVLFRQLETPEKYFVDNYMTAVLADVLIEFDGFQELGYPKTGVPADDWIIGSMNAGRRVTARFCDEPDLQPKMSDKDYCVRFETWSWCEEGADRGRWYDGLIWEHREKKTLGKVSKSMKVLRQLRDESEPSSHFLVAMERYNRFSTLIDTKSDFSRFKVLRSEFDKGAGTTYEERVKRFEAFKAGWRLFDRLATGVDYEKWLSHEKIDFRAPDEMAGGCFYRAHAMCLAIKEIYPSMRVRKIFNFGSGFPEKGTITASVNNSSGKSTEVQWAYHVAPVLSISGTDYVFDPTLFDYPVMIDEWITLQHDHAPMRYEIVPSAEQRDKRVEDFYRPHPYNSTFNNIKWLRYDQPPTVK